MHRITSVASLRSSKRASSLASKQIIAIDPAQHCRSPIVAPPSPLICVHLCRPFSVSLFAQSVSELSSSEFGGQWLARFAFLLLILRPRFVYLSPPLKSSSVIGQLNGLNE